MIELKLKNSSNLSNDNELKNLFSHDFLKIPVIEISKEITE